MRNISQWQQGLAEGNNCCITQGCLSWMGWRGGTELYGNRIFFCHAFYFRENRTFIGELCKVSNNWNDREALRTMDYYSPVQLVDVFNVPKECADLFWPQQQLLSVYDLPQVILPSHIMPWASPWSQEARKQGRPPPWVLTQYCGSCATTLSGTLISALRGEFIFPWP